MLKLSNTELWPAKLMTELLELSTNENKRVTWNPGEKIFSRFNQILKNFSFFLPQEKGWDFDEGGLQQVLLGGDDAVELGVAIVIEDDYAWRKWRNSDWNFFNQRENFLNVKKQTVRKHNKIVCYKWSRVNLSGSVKGFSKKNVENHYQLSWT